MKRKYIVFGIILFIILLFSVIYLALTKKGVDDLQGRWEFEWLLDGQEQPPLILFFDELVELPNLPDQVFASGCMRSPDTDVFMPLTLAAIPDTDNDTYEVTIYSSIVPSGEDPFVIRFTGEVSVHGQGLSDDKAKGDITTDQAAGMWKGIHHDRRQTECPSVDYSQFIRADLRLQQDIAYNPPSTNMIFDLYTPVVSSALQVELPDGSIRIIEYYAGIFYPDVDFVSSFRFFEDFEGEQPIVGESYNFILLDMFGEPIPGTELSDVYWRCTLDAPRDLVASGSYGSDVNLSWGQVPVIPEEFDPVLQGPGPEFHPPYQININAFKDTPEGQSYGALAFTNTHNIPWNDFIPGDYGFPDGYDFGQPLEEFPTGMYQIGMDSWNMSVVDQGGRYQDCEVSDSSETLFMEIQDDQLTFINSGTISGTVTLTGGGPISDVWVVACDYDNDENPFCEGSSTNTQGEYRITRLLPGDYRVSVEGGQGGWLNEFYPETPIYEEAIRVTVYPGADTRDIDFTMEISE